MLIPVAATLLGGFSVPAYAELHALSNFSFQRGASHAHELIERAHALGYAALAITDECSLAGVVRAHSALADLKKTEPSLALRLILGAEFKVRALTPFTLVVLATNRNGYGNLSEFVTGLRRAGDKNHYALNRDDLAPTPSAPHAELLADCLLLIAPDRGCTASQLHELANWAQRHFAGRAWLALELLHQLGDAVWHAQMRQASLASGLPLVAAGNVHMHVRSRKPLQDVITAVKAGKALSACGHALQPNAESHLRSRLRLGQIYPADALAQTVVIAARCTFSLDELRYEYPDEVVPAGQTAAQYLQHMVWQGAAQRFPAGTPAAVQSQIAHELALIAELRYEHYFLTVYDIVRFARSQGILCQGRGSAANSVVCYCLHITEVDPVRMTVLFERFISKERGEPPDIDVDFEHQRREEVIQYLYRKYGRNRAALTATVATYRSRSAIRDVGKALGFAPEHIDALAKDQRWFDRSVADDNMPEPPQPDGADVRAAPGNLAAFGGSSDLAALGFDLADPRVALLFKLTEQLRGFPRHLGQHTGGFVLSNGPLHRMVPIENASMPERSVIQWDKDDLDTLGLMKVDVLALGMLSAIRRSLGLIGHLRGAEFVMQDIPGDCRQTYDMICRADTVGVFQIESRAQMSMLPRLKPRNFYDLVIEVAIVRPGPIQGGMVHPYLRRRQGLEPVVFPSQALELALGRTLGVPIFQEQVMQVAILAAGFTPGEADQLRRAMAAWKRKGGVHKFHERVVSGMLERGYERGFAEQIFSQIQGFGEYGFPESHAASFALLVYASCWIKCHYPAVFLVALLNSQPMGFYSASALVQDARRARVQVLPIDVMHSQSESSLVNATTVRLGLHLIDGLRKSTHAPLILAREDAAFDSVDDLAKRAGLSAADLKLLAAADALSSLSGHRRAQVWDAAAVAPPLADLLFDAPIQESCADWVELAPPSEGEDVLFDFAATGLSLRRHPLALLRTQLAAQNLQTAAQLARCRHNQLVKACGIVTMRQQPQTAKGVVFVTLEDETGSVNVIVWKRLRERQRPILLHARLMAVYGQWQLDESTGGQVKHLIAQHLVDLTPMLGRLDISSRDFH